MPIESDNASAALLWAIVLAGGEGVHLRPMVRRLCGDERPKQFAKISGSKSFLGHSPSIMLHLLNVLPEMASIYPRLIA